MAIKNFTQFALSGTADNGDFLVGYKKDRSQELRFTVADVLTGGSLDYRFLRPAPATTAGAIGANTAAGRGALGSIQPDAGGYYGSYNTAFGWYASNSNTTGVRNAAFGSNALQDNTGDDNTAVGATALAAGGSGSSNVAVGAKALTFNTSGNNNTAVGYNSLLQLLSGNHNAALGHSSLVNLLSGSYNTGVGFYTGGLGYSGNNNVYLGYYAGLGDDGRINCTGLGYYTQTTGNNQVQLGNSVTTTYAYGAVQNRSDIRDKADVRDTTLGLDFIMALRPVDFKWDLRESYNTPLPVVPSSEATEEEKENYKLQMVQWAQTNNINNIVHDGTHKRSRYHHGLIAQEVKQVLDEKGIDFGGYQDHSVKGGKDVQSIGYNELVAPLIKAIQELKQEFDAYKASHPV